MVTVFRLLLFATSTFGFWLFLSRHSKIEVYFLPGLIVAIQVTILFWGGILNLLSEVSFFLYGAGILIFLFLIIKERKDLKILIHKYIQPGFFFLGVIFILFAIFLRDECFERTDNYSHWGLVVKAMLKTDRFPTFQDTIIKFKEYPLGSSSFIYFFSRLVGQSEPIWMLAQVYMMLVSILPLFSIGKKKPVLTTIIVIIATAFFFTYNILPRDILVDTLLPLVGMSGLLYANNYCREINRDKIIEFFFSVFYMIQMIQIKNSGIFFYSIIAFFIILKLKKDHKYIARFSCISIPLLTLLIWHRHCSYVFEQAQTSKHAMTVSNLSSVFGEKTADEIQYVSQSLFHFSITYQDTWLIILLIIIVAIIAFLISKEQGIQYGRAVFFFVALYAFYCIGMLIMYLFSMPTEEAMRLASNTRYLRSIIIAIFYLIAAYIIKYSSMVCNITKKLFTKTCIWILLGGIMIGVVYFTYGKYPKHVSQSVTRRRYVENIQNNYGIPEGAKCTIVISENDNWVHMAYMGKYLFYSPKTTAIFVENEEDIDRINANYIIVLDQENPTINQWIRDNYPEQAGNAVIIRE